MAFPVTSRHAAFTRERSRAASPTVTSEARRGPHVVALGGGTGLPAVLEGLSLLAREKGETDPYAVTGIVTVTDDGGSSGRLRQQFGVLPPGDARNCLVALIDSDSRFKELLQHRL